LKTTVRGVIPHLTEENRSFLDDLMTRFCTAGRWSYKRLLDGWKLQSIRVAAAEKFNLNSRQANDAVYKAQATIKSQKELVKLNHSNAIKKLEHTNSRIKCSRSKKKIANLNRKLDKEALRLAKLQKHIENDTTPPVVFGGKKLFIERCKGNITREEWQEARSNHYLSRGDKTKGGNLNTRLYTIDGDIYLDIAAEPYETGKVIRYSRITVPVYLAHKPSQKTGRINGRNYRQMVLNYLKTGNAYQVEIIRKNARYYIHVAIEEEIPQVYTARNGTVGIDTNPSGLGITRADYLGRYRESMWLPQGEWTYARSNRRDNLIGETAAFVVELAKQSNSTLAVEDLTFKDDKSVTAKFNRMSHSFVWSNFLEKAERRAARAGVPLVKIKPPFTSTIGILKYQQQYHISNHEAAGYVIARRALGYNIEKVPKPLINRFIKEKESFSRLSNWKQWNLVKKAIISVIKKQNIQEVQSLVSWQHYRKQLLS
jgi:IS605 OrfB family transposase